MNGFVSEEKIGHFVAGHVVCKFGHQLFHYVWSYEKRVVIIVSVTLV